MANETQDEQARRAIASAICNINSGDNQEIRNTFATEEVRDAIIRMANETQDEQTRKFIAAAICNIATGNNQERKRTFATIEVKDAIIKMANETQDNEARRVTAKAIRNITSGDNQEIKNIFATAEVKNAIIKMANETQDKKVVRSIESAKRYLTSGNSDAFIDEYSLDKTAWLYAHQVSLGLDCLVKGDYPNLVVIPIWKEAYFGHSVIHAETDISIQSIDGVDENGDNRYIDRHASRFEGKKYPLTLLIPYNLSGNHFELAEVKLESENKVREVNIFNYLNSDYKELRNVVKEQLHIDLPVTYAKHFTCHDQKFIGCSDGRCGDAVVTIARLKANKLNSAYAHLGNPPYNFEITPPLSDEQRRKIFDDLREKYFQEGWISRQDMTRSVVINEVKKASSQKISKKDSEWKLEIHQLDVGQGDSALVLFKKLNPISKKHETNKSILIDGGCGYNVNYLNKYILQNKKNGISNLDVVIITHYDNDHYAGIEKLIDKSFSVFRNTKFILPHDKNAPIARKITSYTQDYVFNSDCLGYNIWHILGISKPNGAPDLKIIEADGFIQKKSNKAKNLDINAKSTVSLVGMEGFHFYTAGDCENNSVVIDYLFQRPNSHDYFPIQAFLTPHHGSKNDSLKTEYINYIGARASLISAGAGHEHPHSDTIIKQKNSDLSFSYITNDVRTANNTDENKMVIAGEEGKKTTSIISKKNPERDPKGTIKLQTYQDIAKPGIEKFMVKYQNISSKTRDYFKDTKFADLKNRLRTMIGMDIFQTFKIGDNYEIPLSAMNLKSFLDEDSKIKHLNPATIKEFIDNYRKDFNSSQKDYLLKVIFKNDCVKFELELESTFYEHHYVGSYYIAEPKSLVSRVSNLGSENIRLPINNGHPYLFLTQEEYKNINYNDNKTYSVPQFVKNIVAKREKDQENSDTGFVIQVNSNENNAIEIRKFERLPKTLLTKEYFKDQRTHRSESETFNKVIARRTEHQKKRFREIPFTKLTIDKIKQWLNCDLDDAHSKYDDLKTLIDQSTPEIPLYTKTEITEFMVKIIQHLQEKPDIALREKSECFLQYLTGKNLIDHHVISKANLNFTSQQAAKKSPSSTFISPKNSGQPSNSKKQHSSINMS